MLPVVIVTSYARRVLYSLSRLAVPEAPLQSESRIQLKVLIAIARGIAFVATPDALDRIEAMDGKYLLIAYEAEFPAKN